LSAVGVVPCTEEESITKKLIMWVQTDKKNGVTRQDKSSRDYPSYLFWFLIDDVAGYTASFST